jgi:hypothetical protein
MASLGNAESWAGAGVSIVTERAGRDFFWAGIQCSNRDRNRDRETETETEIETEVRDRDRAQLEIAQTVTVPGDCRFNNCVVL